MAKESRPTSNERREAARNQAAQRRAEQLKRDSRNRLIMIIAIAVSLAVAVGAIVFAVYKKKANAGKVDQPAVATETGGVSFAGATKKAGTSSERKPVLDIYFDYSCGACAHFELAQRETIAKLLEDDAVNVVLHPVSILGSTYTDAAANAFYEVVDKNPELAYDFHEKLFGVFLEATQAQDASMMSFQAIQNAAKELGVPQATIDAFSKNTYAPLVSASTTDFVTRSNSGELSADKRAATPTVVKDGQPSDFALLMQPGGLDQWVRTNTYPTPVPAQTAK